MLHWFVVLGLTFTQANAESHQVGTLPKLDIDRQRISVSGISSGAYFAVQFHLSHSNLIQGAGIVAGGIYWCAEGNSNRAQLACMGQPQLANLEHSVSKANEQAQLGLVDPLSNLQNDRVYIFGAPNDSIIKQEHATLLEKFYGHFTENELIVRATHPKAVHVFLTHNFGNACGTSGLPWMQNCDVDMAGNILDHLDPNWIKSELPTTAGELIYFDQAVYAIEAGQLYPWGALYAPKNCLNKKCGLHIAFHGCQMTPDFINEQFITNAGYEAAADRHNLVVLFPQSNKSKGNPYGCWDWYGLYGNDYVNKNGAQISAVFKMIQSILK